MFSQFLFLSLHLSTMRACQNSQYKYKKLINYTELIPVLINAVQQLSSEVEELKGKISK